jgi:hypothetical protein
MRMMTQYTIDKTQGKKPFRETPVAGAMVAGLFTLAAVFFGYWLASRAKAPENLEMVVKASDYPYPASNIQIQEGDSLEIQVLGSNTSILNCGTGRASPMGLIGDQFQSVSTYPSANLCALIGRIGDGPYFMVGVYYKSTAEVSGKLYLGINDVEPKYCSLTPAEECYRDNTGQLSVKVNVLMK